MWPGLFKRRNVNFQFCAAGSPSCARASRPAANFAWRKYGTYGTFRCRARSSVYARLRSHFAAVFGGRTIKHVAHYLRDRSRGNSEAAWQKPCAQRPRPPQRELYTGRTQRIGRRLDPGGTRACVWAWRSSGRHECGMREPDMRPNYSVAPEISRFA